MVDHVLLMHSFTIRLAGCQTEIARLSASIGLSSAGFKDNSEGTLSPDKVLNQADHAMYQAKQQCRGRICLSDDFSSHF
jgi:GGDEF domain-containing protein